MSTEVAKKRKCEVKVEGKAEKKMLKGMQELNIGDVNAEDFDMETDIEDMDIDKDLKKLVVKKSRKQKSSSATEDSESASSSEIAQKKKKVVKLKIFQKKKDKDKEEVKSSKSSKKSDKRLVALEEASQVEDTDAKPQLKKKLELFLAEVKKDIQFWKQQSEKNEADKKPLKPLQKLTASQKQLEGALKKLKTEKVKVALLAAHQHLQESKAEKSTVSGQKK